MKLASMAAAAVLSTGSAGAAPANAPRLPPTPADAPAPDETPLETRDDPVVLRCEKHAQAMEQGTGRRRVKVVITQSPRWGTVWRVDSAFPAEGGAPPSLWRTVCWKSGVLERPLDMFDPSQSVPPL
jgi:hypothetical protein